MDIVFEISKLIKFSSKREAIFSKLKEELAPGNPGIRTLCPTRWTVRAAAVQSILANYNVLLSLWEECLTNNRLDSETRARINGVKVQMQKSSFLVGVIFAEKVLSITDNLSKTLQNSTISAAEGQVLAEMSINILKDMRFPDAAFQGLWQTILQKSVDLDLDPPALPRKKKAPTRFEIGEGSGQYHQDSKAYYRQIFFEMIDCAITSIESRFKQQGYKTLIRLENVLIKSIQGVDCDEDIAYVTSFYGNDLDGPSLKAQLTIFKGQFLEQQQRLRFKILFQK